MRGNCGVPIKSLWYACQPCGKAGHAGFDRDYGGEHSCGDCTVGGTDRYGTNPIAFAAPRAGEDPLVIDLSLSVVARGKVMNAKKTGQSIPAGWALDKDGQSTTDPNAALDGGTMVPIGEAKGTALALMVEILAASLTGANTSADMPSFLHHLVHRRMPVNS